MQNRRWRHISTISVNYKHGEVYLSNVASGLDAHSSSYIFGDIFPTILIWWRSKNANYWTPSQSPKSICSSAYFNIKFWYFKRLNKYFLWLHCLLTTNGQLNDVRGYHIKPTNFRVSSYRLVLVRSWQNILFFSAVKF